MKAAGFIVTAKIRLGFKKNNIMEVAKAIEAAGASAITVHPRLASEGYNVPADYSWIKKVKSAVKIPVIGNGDILSPEAAKEMLETTGCDAIMIARGAIGDPLIFSRTLNYLTNGKKAEEFSFKDNIKCFQEYLKLSEKHKLTSNIPNIKHLACKFIKNIEGASKLRNELMQAKTFKEITKFFYGILGDREKRSFCSV